MIRRAVCAKEMIVLSMALGGGKGYSYPITKISGLRYEILDLICSKALLYDQLLQN